MVRAIAANVWTPLMTPTRRTTDEILAAKRAKEKSLKAQIANLEQRKRSEDRRRDVRRKIIVGAAALEEAAADADFRSLLSAALRRSITREADRSVIADLIHEPGGESNRQSG